ncbi:MAG: anti-sigma factor domain-containing protein [Acidimicrobiia bacterium]
MAGRLSREELDALLGAHALDADEPAEREQVEQYLAENPTARAEVDETREIMSLLVDLEEGPPSLWTRIQAEISQDQDETNVRPLARPTRSRPRRISSRVLAVAAAAAVVVIAIIGVVALRDDGAPDRVAQLARAAEDARTDPDARQAALADGDGVARATVVYLPDGTGYVTNKALDELPDGKTYQLWAVVDDGRGPAVVSAGVLGRDVEVAAFRYDGPVRGFAISTEDVPGALAPHEPLAAEGALA